jgi:hypothetical protein
MQQLKARRLASQAMKITLGIPMLLHLSRMLECRCHIVFNRIYHQRSQRLMIAR